jgi:hypothetical protein
MSKTLWHTIQIKVPKEMVELTKSGKVSVKKTLTKTLNISRSQKTPAIKLIPSDVNKPHIVNDGKEWNIDVLKERMAKARAMRKKNENKNVFEPKIKNMVNLNKFEGNIIKRARELGVKKKEADAKNKENTNGYSFEQLKEIASIRKAKQGNVMELIRNAKLKPKKQLITQKRPYKFLSDYLNITESSNNDSQFRDSDGQHAKHIDRLFDILDDAIDQQTILDFKDGLNFDGLSYVQNWLNRKVDAGHSAEYTDFVKKVIYPQLLKYNPHADKFLLMVVANDLGLDPMINTRNENSSVLPPPNKGRVMNTFLDHKIPQLRTRLKQLIPNFNKLFESYSRSVSGFRKPEDFIK